MKPAPGPEAAYRGPLRRFLAGRRGPTGILGAGFRPWKRSSGGLRPVTSDAISLQIQGIAGITTTVLRPADPPKQPHTCRVGGRFRFLLRVAGAVLLPRKAFRDRNCSLRPSPGTDFGPCLGGGARV